MVTDSRFRALIALSFTLAVGAVRGEVLHYDYREVRLPGKGHDMSAETQKHFRDNYLAGGLSEADAIENVEKMRAGLERLGEGKARDGKVTILLHGPFFMVRRQFLDNGGTMLEILGDNTYSTYSGVKNQLSGTISARSKNLRIDGPNHASMSHTIGLSFASSLFGGEDWRVRFTNSTMTQVGNLVTFDRGNSQYVVRVDAKDRPLSFAIFTNGQPSLQVSADFYVKVGERFFAHQVEIRRDTTMIQNYTLQGAEASESDVRAEWNRISPAGASTVDFPKSGGRFFKSTGSLDEMVERDRQSLDNPKSSEPAQVPYVTRAQAVGTAPAIAKKSTAKGLKDGAAFGFAILVFATALAGANRYRS